jgi:hypothetical protein
MNTGHGEKLSRKMEQAIAALLSKPTLQTAAQEVGISATTLWRWLQIQTFKTRYRAARLEVVDAAIREVQGAATEAVETLKRNMKCGEALIEVRAAVAVLDQAIKGHQLLEANQTTEPEVRGWRMRGSL